MGIDHSKFKNCLSKRFCGYHGIIILNVWSQYDGGKTGERTIGVDCRQNQEAKLKNVGGVIL